MSTKSDHKWSLLLFSGCFENRDLLSNNINLKLRITPVGSLFLKQIANFNYFCCSYLKGASSLNLREIIPGSTKMGIKQPLLLKRLFQLFSCKTLGIFCLWYNSCHAEKFVSNPLVIFCIDCNTRCFKFVGKHHAVTV